MAILANELRIGNWLANSDAKEPSMKFGRVTQVYMEGFAINYHWPGTWYNSILLTSEILEKCGFEKCNPPNEDFYSYQQATVKSYEPGKYWFKYNNHFIKDVYTVHQLQNLYYALTNKELELKLNDDSSK